MYKSLIADIKSKLADGADIDTVAADISAAINQAKEEHDAETAEKAKREAEAKALAEAKTAAAQDIINAVVNYLEVIGKTEDAKTIADTVNVDMFIKLLDSLNVITGPRVREYCGKPLSSTLSYLLEDSFF